MKTIEITEDQRTQFDVDFIRAYHDLTARHRVIVSTHTFYDAQAEKYRGFIYYYE